MNSVPTGRHLLTVTLGLLALLFYAPFRAYRAVGLVYVFGLLILTLLHGKSYYALGYYPILFAAAAASDTPRKLCTTAGSL